MMLSRVADAIYWMGRYVERAENTARFIEVTQDFVLDVPEGAPRQWEPLISITGDDETFYKRYNAATPRSVIEFLAFDRENPNSILRVLTAARENARSVRETIASEMWENLNDTYQWYLQQMSTGQPWRAPSEFFASVRQRCILFDGITDAAMSRDLGWHFSNLGRQLERADKISRLLDVKYFTLLPNVSDVNSPLDDMQWSSLLRSVSAFELYRKRYHDISVHNVVEFLVLDRRFPRAIHYCLVEADRSLHAITGHPMGGFCTRAEQRLGRLCAQLAYTELDGIIQQGLHEFVDRLQTELNRIGDAIYERFFSLEPIGQEAPVHASQLQA